jgi:hypothetical protein
MGKVVKALKAEAERKRRAALTPDNLLAILKKGRHTTAQLCSKLSASTEEVNKLIHDCQGRGYLLSLFGDNWEVCRAPEGQGRIPEYKSRRDGTYTFGFSADQHLGSKYERLDVLNELYDIFAERGVDRVFNAGNWIDGEARFNKYDLKVHGMDQQLWYLAEHYPQREGIVTYSVAGDDHEGWYGQREGIDIGKHAERIMRDAGRKDWVHLGFMEAFVSLVHAKSKQSCQLLLIHPGGGSSYAHSYKPQKIVESFEGGEKPAILLIGHYHKLSYNIIRNVYTIQSGTTQDQTTFMRKKGIDAHIGGGVCTVKQDPETGALMSCNVEIFKFYNSAHYNHRWSHGGDVVLVPKRKW